MTLTQYSRNMSRYIAIYGKKKGNSRLENYNKWNRQFTRWAQQND